MSKHTPGPWFVMNGGDIFTALGAKTAEGTEAPSNDGWMIADCDMGCLSYEEAIANARLIAAAPDLLEALEGIMRRIVRYRDMPIGSEWDVAIAAIDKATGGAA